MYSRKTNKDFFKDFENKIKMFEKIKYLKKNSANLLIIDHWGKIKKSFVFHTIWFSKAIAQVIIFAST